MKGMTPLEIWVAIGRNVKERVAEGDGVWRTCAGCYETIDGADDGHYPFSSVFECKVGGGCGECGGLGVVWDTTDYGEMADELAAEMNAPSPIASAGAADE